MRCDALHCVASASAKLGRERPREVQCNQRQDQTCAGVGVIHASRAVINCEQSDVRLVGRKKHVEVHRYPDCPAYY